MGRELNERERAQTMEAFNTGTPIHGFMPMRLPNGRDVPQINVDCRQCKRRIGPEMVRGHITRPLPHVVNIDAAAYCEYCQHITRVLMRVRAVDDTYQVELPAAGGWQSIRPVPASALQRFWRWLFTSLPPN